LHPESSPKEIWRQVYPAVIPGHGALPRLERRTAENQLYMRVHWRL